MTAELHTHPQLSRRCVHEVNLGERGVDFDCFNEPEMGFHSVLDSTDSVWNVGPKKRKDIIDCRRVFERAKVDGRPDRVAACGFLAI